MSNIPIQEPHPLRRVLKYMGVAVVACLFIAGTALLVVWALKTITSKSAQSTDSLKVATPVKQVFASLVSKDAVASLGSDKYTTRPMASSDIYYKDGSHPYGVSVSTDFTQLYEPITPSTSDDTTAVNADVERLLAQYDMTAVDSPIPPSKSISYKSFANTTIICQIRTTTPAAESGLPRLHQLSCVDKTDISDRYARIEALLSVYATSAGTLKPELVSYTEESENDVSYTLLAITTDTSTKNLLFAKVGKTTEFLADLAEGDQSFNNGKYNITPEVKRKISDPKYNGFLLRQIAGVQ